MGIKARIGGGEGTYGRSAIWVGNFSRSVRAQLVRLGRRKGQGRIPADAEDWYILDSRRSCEKQIPDAAGRGGSVEAAPDLAHPSVDTDLWARRHLTSDVYISDPSGGCG